MDLLVRNKPGIRADSARSRSWPQESALAAELGEDRVLTAVQTRGIWRLPHRARHVGSAHMSWIDTALVRDSEADLPSFAESNVESNVE